MKRISLLLVLSVMALSRLTAQVLSVSPVFPKEIDTVTIVYNAKLGNGALVGASQVYAHTGVITTASTSGSDWKHVVGTWGTADNRTKMTYMGNDLWKIRFHVKDFYSQGGAFGASEVILQMAFVFRNADGSKVGKSANGTDIFTPIYSTGLAAKFTLPETRDNMIASGSTQKIEVWSSRVCDIALLLNGDTLRKSNTQDSFQASISNWKVGKNVLALPRNTALLPRLIPSVSRLIQPWCKRLCHRAWNKGSITWMTPPCCWPCTPRIKIMSTSSAISTTGAPIPRIS